MLTLLEDKLVTHRLPNTDKSHKIKFQAKIYNCGTK